MKQWVLCWCCVWLPALAWANFMGFELTPDATGLTLQIGSGQRQVIAPIPGQVAFGAVQLAPGATHVGWLALFPPCCEVEPVALKLLVQGLDGEVRRFEGNDTAFTRWCFHPDGEHVVFQQAVLQGRYQHHYEQVRIADGKSIAAYDPTENSADAGSLSAGLPDWAACLAESTLEHD